MCVCLYRTNSVCLPDRMSLAISSSKTSFPFSANANPSLCALHSCPAQQITSWPVTGGWRISVWTVPWLSIWSLGTSCKRRVSTPASRQRPRTNRGANLLLSGQHTHAHTQTQTLWSMRKAECLSYLWLGFHEQKPHPVWMTIWSFTRSQSALGNAVLAPFLLRFQV